MRLALKTARASCLFWTIVFVLLSLPFLPLLGASLADYPNRNDARLIVWILDWVWYAFWTPGADIAAGPISAPAPAQLTSSDWFYTAQLVFGPIHAATSSAILAANLTAWLTYPLAAICMERLARRLGSDPLPALVAGLFFALASRRVPFNIHLLQNANFLLPLVAVAILNLFDRPDLKRALAATGAFLLACMSALYGGFFAALTGAATLVLAWAQPGTHRMRATGYALGAASLAGAISLLCLQPWLIRAGTEVRPLPLADGTWTTYGAALLGITRVDTASALSFTLPVIALVAAVAAVRDPRLRRGVLFAVALWTVGAMLSPGFPESMKDVLSQTPLTFLAYPDRQQIIADLGRGLLLALGLTGLQRIPIRVLQPLATAAFAILILATRGTAFVGGTFSEPPAFGADRDAYEAVARAAREKSSSHTVAQTGPLLELPLRLPNPPGKGTPTAPDSMLGQSLHRIGLIDGYTGYHPPHRGFVLDAIGRLPSANALGDLRRATRLEWILLRPEADWIGYQPTRASMVSFLQNAPEVDELLEFDGWTLAHLQPTAPGDWSRAIAGGTDRTRTALGADASLLTVGATKGQLRTTALPPAGRANQFLRVDVSLENTGRPAWPVTVRSPRALMLDFGTDRPRGRFQEGSLQRTTPFPANLSVVIAVGWERRDKPSAAAPLQFLPLPRDLPAGESLQFPALLRYPKTPGEYELTLQVAQMNGGKPIDLDVPAATQTIRIGP